MIWNFPSQIQLMQSSLVFLNFTAECNITTLWISFYITQDIFIHNKIIGYNSSIPPPTLVVAKSQFPLSKKLLFGANTGLVEGKQYFDARPLLCDAVATICLGACVTVLLTIGGISFNRYFHICHPDIYPRFAFSCLMNHCKIYFPLCIRNICAFQKVIWFALFWCDLFCLKYVK